MIQDITSTNAMSLLMLPKKYVSNEAIVSSGKTKAIRINNNEFDTDEVIIPNFVRLSPRKNEAYNDSDYKTESNTPEEGSINSNLNDQCWSPRNSADKENINNEISSNENTKTIAIGHLYLSKKYSGKEDNFKVLKSAISYDHLTDASNDISNDVVNAPPNFVRRDPPKRL